MRDDGNEPGPDEAAELIRRAAPGRCLGIVGPAGSGRTTLLDSTAAVDAIRIRGRADEVGHPLLAAAPLVGEAPPPDLPALLATAREVLGEDGTLLVDDIDLLDEATSELIGAIASRSADWSITVVATGTHLPPDWPGERIDLAPLATGAARVATALDITQDDLDGIIVETGGLPRWVAAAASNTLDREMTSALAGLTPQAMRAAGALAWGASPSNDSGTAATGLSADELDRALAELVARGFLAPDQDVLPIAIAGAVRRATPVAARHAIVDTLTTRSPISRATELATWLDEVDDRTGRAAAVYAAAATELRSTDIDVSTRMFEAAAASGDLNEDQQLQFAAARLAGGSPHGALAILHELADASREPAVLLTSAAALARDGRGADAGRVIAELRDVGDDAYVELAPLYEAGQGGGSATAGSPIGTRAAAARFAAASATWMNEGAPALPELAVAATAAADLPDVDLWPWHPLELLAAAATLERRFDMAEDATLRLRSAGVAVPEREALINLRASRLADVEPPAAEAAGTRHACLAHAVTSGMALRRQQSDQLEGLVIDGPSPSLQPDLWSTDVVCELALVASRTDGLTAATELLSPLERLSDDHAPTSTVARTLGWTHLLTGVLTDDAATVAAAADALHAGSDSVEKRAASVFAQVFSGRVVPEDVESAATELRDAGMGFEASQLSGAAALRSGDENATRDLLALSRQLRNERRQSTGSRGGDVEALSDREVEVARLVVLGRTHKEIGAELFISAKTVEHHVARIRRKLGATSRAEMMAAIRDYLDRHASVD